MLCWGRLSADWDAVVVQVSGGKEEERRWRDPKWAPAINIMPFDLPHIMIMIIYIPLLVCYDSIAITPGKGGKRRGSLICVLLAIFCVLL